MPQVLHELVSELSETPSREMFLPSLGTRGARELIASVAPDEYKNFERGLRDGVDNGDWMGLITHRKFDSVFWRSSHLLITASARIRLLAHRPSTPRVSAETP
jgi:hypothetical protein